MGTIIALGGGRYDDGEVMPIFERIVRESGKENPHVVFLPTAGHDDTEGDEPIWESFEKLGCTVETLKLTDPANSREHIYNTLVSTDIVYAGGGNLEFMMNTFKATGADEALREAYKR
ncbi:MAG: Type 1 glutamine amidotransferase-like domain-containing protein, partial [Oscillospiraceae bacterium]|nr:Type 1 glutamine amidotransferase-like domain-containing protein [Oscillospiraceae bacterium]